MLKTPVLFLIFNRPNVTTHVFEEIKKQKPKHLYVAGDGPRNKQEEILCDEARKIATNIDWDCEVKTLFRESNLGCQQAVYKAITWFFENEEEGIIVEDDCLPSESFWTYCEQLLAKYRDDKRVMHISGETQIAENLTEDSYYFSRIPHIWGWASWKRAWAKYDVGMNDYPDFVKKKKIKSIFKNSYHQSDWQKILKQMYDKKIDTWDYIWCYTLFNNDGFSIIPNKNLVSNIGFGENSTHTSEITELANKPLSEIDLILKHPEKTQIDEEIQHRVLNERYNMPDSFSFERHKTLKIIIRETERALHKAGLKK